MPMLWMCVGSRRPACATHATTSSASRKSSCFVLWLTTNHSNWPALGSAYGAATMPPAPVIAPSVEPSEYAASKGPLPVACQ